MKKAIVRTLFLFVVVCAHFVFGEFFIFPDWFGYAEHFFIGGIMTAWAGIAVLKWLRKNAYFESILGCCSFVGIVWEVFEYWGFQRVVKNSNYYGDTIWDFQMNFLGAIIVALIYCKK